MRRLLLCLLFLCSPVGAVDFVTDLPACAASDMWEVWLGFESSDTDCTDDLTNAGSTLSKCCCLNGSVYSCKGVAGSGAVALDLGDDGGGDSSAIGEIATVRDDYGFATEPSADKLLLDLGLVAPYRQYDPLRAPVSFGTGGFREDWTGNAEAQSWSWGNQDSSTLTLALDGALIVGDTAADEIHARGVAAPSNQDQTWTVRVNGDLFTSNNDACAIGFINAGTVATPTGLYIFQYVNGSISDEFVFFSATSYAFAGASTIGATIVYPISTFHAVSHCLQVRYTDSSRDTQVYFSGTCKDPWKKVGNSATPGADPLFWFISARDGGSCMYDFAQLRTDANRNLASDD